MRRLTLGFTAALALAGCGGEYTNARTGAMPDDWQRAQAYARAQTAIALPAGATATPSIHSAVYDAIMADGAATEPGDLKRTLDGIVVTVHRRLADGESRAQVIGYVSGRMQTLMPAYDALADTRVEEGFVNRINDELHAVGFRVIDALDEVFPIDQALVEAGIIPPP